MSSKRQWVSLQTVTGFINVCPDDVGLIGRVYDNEGVAQRAIHVKGVAFTIYILEHDANLDALGFVGSRESVPSEPMPKRGRRKKNP